MTTYSAIATTAVGKFDQIELPTVKPGPEEVLIKVDSASLMVFDTYVADLGFAVGEHPVVLGFNAAGTVVEVGSGAGNLKVGDRVTAMAYQKPVARAAQQYVTLPYTVCAKIPESLSFEKAATIPDNFVTAFFTLFNKVNLGLSAPTSFPSTAAPPSADVPILIYGAGATSGQYAIQLLHLAGYKRIFATASPKHHDLLRNLGATNVFDYNSATLAADVSTAAGGDSKVQFAMDCISAEATLATIAKVLSPSGTVAVLLPVKDGNTLSGTALHFSIPDGKNPFPSSVKVKNVSTFTFQDDEYLKYNLLPKILPSLLESGSIEPSRVRLLDQGTFKERVSTGLDLLRDNKVSGEKVIVKVPAST